MSGQEIPGLCLLTIFSMGGMLGPENIDLEKDFTLLLWLGIPINDSLFLPQYTETCVISLKEKIINRFMNVTKTLVGPQWEMASQIGLKIVGDGISNWIKNGKVPWHETLSSFDSKIWFTSQFFRWL